jgi:hypothetical protein
VYRYWPMAMAMGVSFFGCLIVVCGVSGEQLQLEIEIQMFGILVGLIS